MCLLGYSIVLERRECDLNLNDCFFGGVKDVGDIFEAQSQRNLEFVEARQLMHISSKYGLIWQ